MLTSPIAVVPALTHMHSENISTAQIYKFTFGTSHLLAKTDQITEREFTNSFVLDKLVLWNMIQDQRGFFWTENRPDGEEISSTK